MSKQKQRLGILSVALMYVGTIMGAGFASGREIWQFFGVFGKQGYIGVALAGGMFIVIGLMTSRIARTLGTNDMGRIIVPGGNRRLIDFVGAFMALMLFTILITMSSAGGALFHQQLGQSRILGGVVIIAMVVLTVMGGFARVSRVFQFVMPGLALAVVFVCVLVVLRDLPPSGISAELVPSPLAGTWFLAAPLYISYNILAVIPIVSTASINAKSDRHALLGTGLGGIFLGLLAFLLVAAMRSDAEFSQTMDMPILAFSARLSEGINILYTGVLLFAIYASATSNYYGFTTALPQMRHRKLLILSIAWIAFAFGLVGFSNVVAYMLPIEGFLGLVIIAMLVANFIKTSIMRNDKTMEKETKTEIMTPKDTSLFGEFKDHDRFAMPKGIVRVTAGQGGEALLIFGSEKTALFDCGMAYCGEQTVRNIRAALQLAKEQYGDRTIDYVMLSHTHYDHIGALPYVRRAFPDAAVCGASHARTVFGKPGAIRVMKELGERARDDYSDSKEAIPTEGLSVDLIVRDGDRISLGKEELLVLETPGHTDCSLAFLLLPAQILFSSESTGVLESPSRMYSAILKSYSDSMRSLEKCRALHAKTIISPHYGVVPVEFNDQYWDLFEESTEDKKEFVNSLYDEGLSEEEMLARYTEHYWEEKRANEQPMAAFLINAKNIIKVILKEFE